MAVRSIRRASGTTSLRSYQPTWIDILSDSADSDRLKFKDSTGTVQSLVRRSDSDPFAAVDGSTRYVEVALTNAEIKALRATPKQLVAAPGAGKMIQFCRATLILDAGTNVLTETAANLGIKYTDGSGVQVCETVEATGFIDQAGDTATDARLKLDAIVAKAGCENQALVLHNLGAGEYGGNAAADATMRVKVWYSVITTGW